jgi:hypothetical protein
MGIEFACYSITVRSTIAFDEQVFILPGWQSLELIAPLIPALATGYSAAGEFGAATTGTGKPIDRGPTDTSVIADPRFTVGCDSRKERQLAVATIGLPPVTLPGGFIPPQVDCAAYRIDAVRIAFDIHASQQVGASGAIGQGWNLRLGSRSTQQ